MMRLAKSLFLRVTVLLIILLSLLLYYVHYRRVDLVTSLNIFKQYVPDIVVRSRSENKLEMVVKPIPISYSLENCPVAKDNMLNVHFILHTHDDPGWLKTPDEYYDQDVREILFSVMDELKKDQKRKFVYSEMYFFKKWWIELNETMQNLVTEFIINGQLEFVGGGWVQNDDALTHYTVIIDQMSYGLNEIKKNFGLKARPAFGWQIDSFGYSKEQAALFSQFGYEAEAIQRLPWYDLDRRRENGYMEFIWKGDKRNKIFTHILYDSYVAPTGFRYETEFSTDDINDSNVNSKVELIFQTAKLRSKSYRTNHLMLLMGHDFVYKKASIWFNNVEQLIVHGNKLNESKINLMFSTPSCYLKYARKQLESVPLPEKTDDFFPYCNNKMSMWTGFYASRPTLKGLIQKIASMLQVVENLESAVTTVSSRNLLNIMREYFFTTLHHDAITGTCKQAVANDYIRSLVKAEIYGQKLLDLIHIELSGNKNEERRVDKSVVSQPSVFCPLLNISLCSFTQNEKEFVVTIFNGHSKLRREYVRIPVESTDYTVVDWKNDSIMAQTTEVMYDILQMPKSKSSTYDLIVPVELPPLGFATYFVRKSAGETKIVKDEIKKSNFIENEFYKVIFNSTTGLLVGIENKKENTYLRISQQFIWYENPSSGAYILRPTVMHELNKDNVTLKRSEARMSYKGCNVTFYREGKEIATRFTVDVNNGATFYTDANGRQLVERKSILPSPEPLDYPIGAAYYPLTSMITIKDNTTQMIVVTDRPVGGSSVLNGTLELLLHRKVMGDDGAGMGEGLYETGEDGRPIVVRGVFRFAFSAVGTANLMSSWRELAKEMFYAPVLKFSHSTNVDENLNHFSLLKSDLPDGIHLLSYQRIDVDYVLIRLENYFEDAAQTVSLEAVDDNIKACAEMMLSGDVKKLSSNEIDLSAIVLEPMSIVTLLCSL